MVGCDGPGCDGWYHPNCVGLANAEARDLASVTGPMFAGAAAATGDAEWAEVAYRCPLCYLRACPDWADSPSRFLQNHF